ncbi:MAG: phosphotransferase family protein, partial [Alphaproteobacteria bacterium]|nr:phosphotransferase family protein [Alphaproteobacteria bacterium]
MSGDEQRERVEAALRRVAPGLAVTRVTALSGGAASMTYAVEATLGEAAWPLILQCSPARETMLPRAGQAELIRLAGAHGLRVPEVVLVLTPEDGLGDGFVTRRIEGEALAPKWLRLPEFAGARAAMTADCAAALARLHAIPVGDPAAAALPPQPLSRAVEDYFALYRAYDVDRPVLDLAFAVLRERLGDDPPPAIVHGDFRSGNLLVNADGLAAVLDWELAHLGDRHEDIGWLCTNAWRFGEWRKPVGGFGDREAFYDAYEAAGGAPVDRPRAMLCELWGTLRWAVMCLRMAHEHLTGAIPSVERAAIGR